MTRDHGRVTNNPLADIQRIHSAHSDNNIKYNSMHAKSGASATPTRAVCTKITETEIIRGILRKRDGRVDDTIHAETIGDGPLTIKVTDY